MNSIAALQNNLPPYLGKAELISKRQSVYDIIFEICDAHKHFASDYDKIAPAFDAPTVKEICDKIFVWCKENVKYKVEPEEKQTTKSPAAIMAQGYGDCKHYASFAGGILDALNRLRNKKINWVYRFASYNLFNNSPEHVFVVVKDKGREVWIDPTPGADKVKPVWQIDKKVKAMPLYRVSGVGYTPPAFPVSDLVDSIDHTINPQLYSAVQMLLKFGAIDLNAKLKPGRMAVLQRQLDQNTYAQLYNAYNVAQQASIGGFFSNVWNAVKKAGLTGPRNAYLSLVGLNLRGWATKYANAIYKNPQNFAAGYTAQMDSIKKGWEKLGGNWSHLEGTIRKGSTHKAILGVAPAAALPAWVAVASAIIAAMTPLLTAALRGRSNETGINFNTDPTTGLPYGTTIPPTDNNSGGLLSTITGNPVLMIGGAVAILYIANRKH